MGGSAYQPPPPHGVGRGSYCDLGDLAVAPQPVGMYGWVPSLCTLQPKYGQGFPPFFDDVRGGGLPACGRPVVVCILEGGRRIFSRGVPPICHSFECL